MSSSQDQPTWQYVCSQTTLHFRAHFQYYFPPVLLVCAVAYACIYALQRVHDRLVIRPSFESIMYPDRFRVPGFIYAAGRASIWSVQLWLIWLVFIFVLAAFAVKMIHDRQQAENPMKIGGTFRLVCHRRLGSLVSISALAGVATGLFSIIMLPLLLQPLSLLLMQHHSFDDYLLVFKWARAALLLFCSALLTKMALAIPELVDDSNASVRSSIRNSIKATGGWEPFFILMFAVVGLATSIVYTAGSFLVYQSWQNGQLSSAGYEMVFAAFTVVVGALAITLLAIAYSVLYVALRYGRFETSLESEDAAGAD